MSTAALFYNSSFVDTSTSAAAGEAANVKSVLASQGHTVKTFTGTDNVSFRRAEATSELLVIPELETASLNSVWGSVDRSYLNQYVFKGGGVIISADSGGNAVSLLNSTFGFGLSYTSTSGFPSARNDAVTPGTAFASGPATLTDNNATYGLTGLPSSGKAMYTANGKATVAAIGYGEGTIVVLGYDFFDAKPNGAQDGGWLSVLNKAVTEVRFPDMDSNDEIGEATTLAAGSPSSNQINYIGDIDVYKFNGTAGAPVTLTMNKSGGSSVDSYLRLFDANGNEITHDDDSGGNRNSKITFTPSTTGTYYLGCTAYQNQAYDPITGLGKNKDGGTTGAFTVTLTGGGGTNDNDPDDEIGEAKPVGIGSTTSASIGNGLTAGTPAGQDVDMYKFTASAGQKIGFDVDRASGSTLDSYLRIFSYNTGTGVATELKNNDNAAAPGESLGKESYAEFTFSAGGTYYATVSGIANKTFSAVNGTGDVTGSTGAYTLTLKSLTSAPADADDQISEAISITTTTTTSGRGLADQNDVDMYKFTVTAGQKVSFNINRPSGSTANTYLRLFTSGGTQLASNNNAAAPGETANSFDAYLQFTFSASGTYYVAVSGATNTAYNALTGLGDTAGGSTGAYTLITKKL